MSTAHSPRFSVQGIREHEEAHRPSTSINVGDAERWASAIGGGLFVAYGVKRGTFGGLALAALGGGLLYRATTGHCHAYDALNIDTSGKHRSPDDQHIHDGRLIKHSVTISRSPEDLYAFWRDENNAPKFMEGITAAKKTGEKTSHWVASGPFGKSTEWDAEIIADEPNRMFAWKTLPGALVPHAGTVKFGPSTGGRGTVVTLELNYEAPGGIFGEAAAKLTGMDPNSISRENLRHFKQLMEAGEVTTIEGQPSGRASDAKKVAHA